MDKKFFQVFENLEIPKKLQELFEDVEVERIVVSKASKMVNVHIFSRHLINRNNIKSMESCINKQLFHNVDEKVRIFERYEYSAKYEAEKIMSIYADDLENIIKEKGNILFSVFKEADYRFEGKKLIFDCENTFIARDKSRELKKVIEHVFNIIFDYEIEVECEYNKEPKVTTKKYTEDTYERRDTFARNTQGSMNGDRNVDGYIMV